MVHGASPDTQEVEVLAEADIYILYGRYREAESILLEALAHSPARADLRFKLAESFIGSGNRDALAKLVEQMKAAGENQLDAAKWASIEQALAAMAPTSGLSGSELPSPGGSRAVNARADSAASAGVTLDIGAAGKGKLASDDFRDSEDSGLGFSLREISPTSADRLQAQLDDLELDLKDLDDLGAIGELGADSDSLPGGSPSAPVAAPPLEMRDEPPPKTESRVDAGASTRFEDDLDLDLDALDKLANLDETTDPPDLTKAVADVEVADFEDDKTFAPLSDPTVGSSAPMEDSSISSDTLSSQWRADSGLWDEAATKMDLARAYLEMEDADAARAILEEVVQEGSAEQQAEANALLAKIG
jgi:pilus assembly protein FimV